MKYLATKRIDENSWYEKLDGLFFNSGIDVTGCVEAIKEDIKTLKNIFNCSTSNIYMF